jgi:Rhodopirellula transposase DDE domain
VEAVEAAVATHTAGSPVDENIVWTNRSPRQIAEEVSAAGYSACADTVRRILTEDLELGLRQAEKEEAGKTCAFREEQFEHIARRRKWYERRGWPVLSIDTKKKELLGDFFRPGRAYTNGAVRVLDHDFATLGSGRLAPYGVYDVAQNEGFLFLGQSADTSEFVCDALWRWWQRLGKRRYWHASGLLLLCDCGGSNGNRQHRFKEDLADLACELRRPIEVAHYPPGCSKFNPIERRMFCHVTRALQGVVLRSIHVARDFMARTTTTSGLKVSVEVARHTYERGRKATAEFLNEMPIRFGKLLPQFNYTALV